MKPVDVSIVVCTHNRAAMLRDALHSLTQLSTEGRFRYEIVVVDNASTDGTAATAADVAAGTLVSVRYVYEARKGIATARNRGLKEASGEWVAFFDDDQLADPRWLITLIDYARQYGLRAVGGAVHLKLPEGCDRNLHPYVRMLLGESKFAGPPFQYTLKQSPGTGNLMLHRSVFEQVGAFNELFAVRAEDTDLFCRMWRAGIEAWYLPNAIVHHVTPRARLERTYLERLSTFMGESVADRERKTLSLPVFLARGLAKAIINSLTAGTRYTAAKRSDDAEATLGLGCRLRAALVYARRYGEIVLGDVRRCLPRLPMAQKAAVAR
jgi:GT2 family glycosyltransferase